MGKSCWKGHTIYWVEDLAICRAGSALLDLGIVDLEELIEPCKKFWTWLAHDCRAIDDRRGRSLCVWERESGTDGTRWKYQSWTNPNPETTTASCISQSSQRAKSRPNCLCNGMRPVLYSTLHVAGQQYKTRGNTRMATAQSFQSLSALTTISILFCSSHFFCKRSLHLLLKERNRNPPRRARGRVV